MLDLDTTVTIAIVLSACCVEVSGIRNIESYYCIRASPGAAYRLSLYYIAVVGILASMHFSNPVCIAVTHTAV